MDKEIKPRKNTVVLVVFAVVTLLIAIIGATFAFFTVNLTGNDSATSLIIKTATLGIMFGDGDEIFINNLMPGDPRLYDSGDDNYAMPKIFTIQNTSTVSLKYTVSWIDIFNDFDEGHDLTYEVTGSSSMGMLGNPGSITAGTSVPSANGVMMSSITILSGEVHTYELMLAFPNTSSNQNAQQGKTFAGKLQISEVQL